MGEGGGGAASKPKLNVKVHVVNVAGRTGRRMGVCTLMPLRTKAVDLLDLVKFGFL